MDPITLRSTDGRNVRVEVGALSLSSQEAMDFATALQRAGVEAEATRGIHERHVNLMASCPLCVFEAGSQPDRLTYDED